MNTVFENWKTFAIMAGTALCFIVAIEGFVSAQGPGGRTRGIERRMERVRQRNEEKARENLTLDSKAVATQPTDSRRETVLGEIRHDLNSLQTSYNRIVLAMAAKEGLNRQSIVKDVDAIRKSAIRLKTNLALPEPEIEQASKETGGGMLEEQLLKLRKHIYDFVTNPLFDDAAIYNIEEAKRAGADLDRVILVSESFNKIANQTKQNN
jgi:hypothetical protein